MTDQTDEVGGERAGAGRNGAGQVDGGRCLVTARDRELLVLLSMARYLTTDQANALVRPGKHESVGRRRLFVLAGLAPRRRETFQGPLALFEPPYIRRLRFRRTTGERLDWWALTRHGEALAAELLRRDARIERRDVAELFREHWAVLTNLFVALAAPLLARGVRATGLPFQWDATEGTELPWRQYDATAGKERERLLVPDAVLSIPGARRRYLIECEMGTHSIVSASDEKVGATLRKTERYDAFFGGATAAAGEKTFYQRSFPDNWPAEVLYLVRTASRRDSVNAALESWRQGRGSVWVTAKAVTLAEAMAELAPLLGLGLPAPQTQTASRTASAADLDVLRRFYQEALLALRSAGASLPDSLRASALEARAVLEPRASAGGQ